MLNNFLIWSRVKIFLDKKDKNFYHIWTITWIKPYSDWYRYYVVDDWYYDFQIFWIDNTENAQYF